MVRLSPEETLLLLTCRPTLSRSDDARLSTLVRGAPDWPFILWRAETYQTLTMLGHHLERLKLVTALPDFVLPYVRNWAALARARSLEQFKALGQLLHQFEHSNIDYFLLKGAAFAGTVYPDPLLRPMQDIDIMVRPRDAWRVQSTVYEMGYRHGVFNPRDGRFVHMFRKISRRSLRTKHALHSVTKTSIIPLPLPREQISSAWQKRQIKSFSRPNGMLAMPVFVDFHVNLSQGMSETDVWRGVRKQDVLGQDVCVQSPTAMLWFSAARLYHEAFQHGTLKLQMLGDIDALLKTHEADIDWAELMVIGQKHAITPALYYVLSQVRQLMDAPVPSAALELLAPRQNLPPAANDWGDVIPKLLSRAVVGQFEYA